MGIFIIIPAMIGAAFAFALMLEPPKEKAVTQMVACVLLMVSLLLMFLGLEVQSALSYREAELELKQIGNAYYLVAGSSVLSHIAVDRSNPAWFQKVQQTATLLDQPLRVDKYAYPLWTEAVGLKRP